MLNLEIFVFVVFFWEDSTFGLWEDCLNVLYMFRFCGLACQITCRTTKRKEEHCIKSDSCRVGKSAFWVGWEIWEPYRDWCPSANSSPHDKTLAFSRMQIIWNFKSEYSLKSIWSGGGKRCYSPCSLICIFLLFFLQVLQAASFVTSKNT